VYVGHANEQSLYLSVGNRLGAEDLSSLATGNLSKNAQIYLQGCKSAYGTDSIAQSFADHFERNTYGWETGLSFGIPKIGIGSYTRHEGTIFPADPVVRTPDYSNYLNYNYNQNLLDNLYYSSSTLGAAGGFVLYPNKPNTNIIRSVYTK
jgi:hypothetical protein